MDSSLSALSNDTLFLVVQHFPWLKQPLPTIPQDEETSSMWHTIYAVTNRFKTLFYLSQFMLQGS